MLDESVDCAYLCYKLLTLLLLPREGTICGSTLILARIPLKRYFAEQLQSIRMLSEHPLGCCHPTLPRSILQQIPLNSIGARMFLSKLILSKSR